MLENPRQTVIADVDGDAFPEIVVTEVGQGSENGVFFHDPRMRALSRTGAVVKTWRLLGLSGAQGWIAAPAIGEFTGDGRTDIAVYVTLILGGGLSGNNSGELTLLTTNTTFNAAAAEWPLQNRDLGNSRSKPASAVCAPETNPQFCTRLGKNCGTVTGTDNCGAPRTVSSCGTCTSPQTCGGGGTPNVCGGGGGTAPCSDLCTNPIVFSSANFNSGNLGAAATCHQTVANLAGAVCGNFATGRTLRVNSVQVTCNNGNITLPAKRNGGYCFQASTGDFPWAYFATW
jgi:hypothetical protein